MNTVSKYVVQSVEFNNCLIKISIVGGINMMLTELTFSENIDSIDEDVFLMSKNISRAKESWDDPTCELSAQQVLNLVHLSDGQHYEC